MKEKESYCLEEDKFFMRRCIELARNAQCTAAPNPMVGAVIVHQGKIIGEGYHVHCGQGHAEVNAIASVKDESLLKHSTIYVSLEPCSHYGKTPPCADLIISKQIPRIVVGCVDPFPQVAGRGIRKLRDAGRTVVVGVLSDECSALIRRFVTFHTEKRPYITLKWAESSDHFIDRIRQADETPALFSTPLTSMLTHKRRAEHKAILVGTNTALMDNPSLNVRHWSGAQPIRVVWGNADRLPDYLHLCDGTQETIFHQGSLPELLEILHARQLQSLLVEGGRKVLQSFIDADLWDEAFVEESPLRLGNGTPSPQMKEHAIYTPEQHFGHHFRHYKNIKE